MIGMKKLVRRLSSFRHKGPLLTGNPDPAAEMPYPRFWLDETGEAGFSGQSWNFIGDSAMNPSVYATELQMQEFELCQLLSKDKEGSPLSEQQLNSMVYTIPDFLHRMGWEWLTNMLSDDNLMRHARVIPHSIAITNFFFHWGGLNLENLRDHTVPRSIVVLNADEIMVDCTPLIFQPVSPLHIVMWEYQQGYIGECVG